MIVNAQQAAPSYLTSTQAFRTNRAKALAAPEGWLSLVGLEWLHEGANTVGSGADNSLHLPSSAPAHLAVITQSGAGAHAQLKISVPVGGFPADLKINGSPTVEGSLANDAKISFGSYTILVLSRGDRLALRIKDLNAETRTHFHGLNWFPVKKSFRVDATWIPYGEPHTIAISTIIGTTLHEKVLGAAEFTLNGKRLRLEPIVEDDKLFFILRDTTSRTTTYEAARFLYTDFPSQGLAHKGEVALDFNRLVNPPCAYTAFATCPLPPLGNRLTVPIPAGEKRYHD
ncbi:DUF1684 domain-containing protein [Terriglobus sp. 2YAB30_2]|uniref:DUF1684 domain-containing protein n=1 Tax=unclassified Terriglobus TaxID=2628988 RepID=UPI003F9A9A35